MAHCRHRMHKKHPGTGKAHDFSNALPHLGLVAVYFAVGAKGLCLHKRTFIAAHSGVIFQLCTFRAEFCFPQPGCFPQRFVLFPAVQKDHLGDHLLFSFPLILYLFVVICFHQCYLLSVPLIFLFNISFSPSAHPPIFHGISTICNPHGGFPVGHQNNCLVLFFLPQRL